MEQVGVGNLLGFLDSYTIGYLVLSFVVTLVGVVSHYVKKCLKAEAEWNTYWVTHKNQTATALMAALGSYGTVLMTETNASLITYLAIGYVVDSMFNKAPKKPN